MNKIKRASVKYFNSKWSSSMWLATLPFMTGILFWEWGVVVSLVLLIIVATNCFFITMGWWCKRKTEAEEEPRLKEK